MDSSQSQSIRGSKECQRQAEVQNGDERGVVDFWPEETADPEGFLKDDFWPDEAAAAAAMADFEDQHIKSRDAALR